MIAYAEANALASPGAEIARELPWAVEHVWSWYCELTLPRTGGLGGITSVGFLEIDAWARRTCNDPSPWETVTLARMDAAVRTILAEKKPSEAVSGSVDDATDADAVKAMFRAMGARTA